MIILVLGCIKTSNQFEAKRTFINMFLLVFFMAEKFILVNLGDEKSKKLANVVGNETSVKILDYLSEKEEASESEVSKNLKISISTVHYNLQQLKKVGLVEVKEFKWSEKGREIDLYKLAKKYIVIAPKESKGLKTRLKGILPVAIIAAIIGGVIQVYNYNKRFISSSFARIGDVEVFSSGVSEKVAMESGDLAGVAMTDVAPNVTASAPEVIVKVASNNGLWFVIGALFALVVYLIWNYRRIK